MVVETRNDLTDTPFKSVEMAPITFAYQGISSTFFCFWTLGNGFWKVWPIMALLYIAETQLLIASNDLQIPAAC